MALYVKIFVNNTLIRCYAAQNMTGKTTGRNTYKIVDVCKSLKPIAEVRHKYEDGAEVLTMKLLKKLRQVKGK